MQTRMRNVIVLLTLAVVTGVWLVVAPFLIGYQPTGDPWVTATANHVATGAVLVVVGLVAVLAIIGGAIRALDAVAPSRPSRTAAAILRIDVGQDPQVPLMVVNAGRDPVFELEATLRFEPRAPRSGYVMERHRRARVLLPGERLGFRLPEDAAEPQTDQLATLVRRVHLDAVGRDSRGRPVEGRDVLDDPLAWLETERRSQPSVAGPDRNREPMTRVVPARFEGRQVRPQEPRTVEADVHGRAQNMDAS